MVVIVADTSPIRYLVQIGCVEVVHQLFRSITVPADVVEELMHPSAPPIVRSWMAELPGWVHVVPAPSIRDPALFSLDRGERSAIILAASLSADLVLIDERKGAAAASSKGLANMGTLGVLDLAAKYGLIDLRDAILRLQQTNFRYKKAILDTILAQAEHR